MQIFAFSFQNHFFLLFGWQQMFVDARKEVLYFIYFAFFYLYRNSEQTQSTIVSMFFLPFDRKRKPYDNSATTTVTKQFWKHILQYLISSNRVSMCLTVKRCVLRRVLRVQWKRTVLRVQWKRTDTQMKSDNNTYIHTEPTNTSSEVCSCLSIVQNTILF